MLTTHKWRVVCGGNISVTSASGHVLTSSRPQKFDCSAVTQRTRVRDVDIRVGELRDRRAARGRRVARGGKRAHEVLVPCGRKKGTCE